MHTCIHAYIHTRFLIAQRHSPCSGLEMRAIIATFDHTCIPYTHKAYIHTYIHTCMHAYKHTICHCAETPFAARVTTTCRLQILIKHRQVTHMITRWCKYIVSLFLALLIFSSQLILYIYIYAQFCVSIQLHTHTHTHTHM
jgi:hypothetical protein